MSEAGKKRGRERVYDAQRTREVILNAAETVFAEHGFDGASMDTIAQTSGYNKSLLFQYFVNKLGLYTHVLKRVDKQVGELMAHMLSPLLEDETIVTDADRFKDFLRNACGSLFDYMVEHPQVMRLFNWEQAEGWKTFTRIASQFEPEDLLKFETLFQRARNSRLLRSDVDVIIIIVLIQQICWSSPTTLPVYQLLFAGKDVSSSSILSHVREQIIAFLVAGMMGERSML